MVFFCLSGSFLVIGVAIAGFKWGLYSQRILSHFVSNWVGFGTVAFFYSLFKCLTSEWSYDENGFETNDWGEKIYCKWGEINEIKYKPWALSYFAKSNKTSFKISPFFTRNYPKIMSDVLHGVLSNNRNAVMDEKIWNDKRIILDQ